MEQYDRDVGRRGIQWGITATASKVMNPRWDNVVSQVREHEGAEVVGKCDAQRSRIAETIDSNVIAVS